MDGAQGLSPPWIRQPLNRKWLLKIRFSPPFISLKGTDAINTDGKMEAVVAVVEAGGGRGGVRGGLSF